MTPLQCIMARAALGWSLTDLADHSKVSRRTIATFETGGTVRPGTVAALQAALEQARAIFVDEGEQFGVMLPKTAQPPEKARVLQFRTARHALRWRVVDLATRAGVSESSIARFETRGRVTSATASMVEEALVSGGASLVECDERIGVTLTRRSGNSLRA